MTKQQIKEIAQDAGFDKGLMMLLITGKSLASDIKNYEEIAPDESDGACLLALIAIAEAVINNAPRYDALVKFAEDQASSCGVLDCDRCDSPDAYCSKAPIVTAARKALNTGR